MSCTVTETVAPALDRLVEGEKRCLHRVTLLWAAGFALEHEPTHEGEEDDGRSVRPAAAFQWTSNVMSRRSR